MKNSWVRNYMFVDFFHDQIWVDVSVLVEGVRDRPFQKNYCEEGEEMKGEIGCLLQKYYGWA